MTSGPPTKPPKPDKTPAAAGTVWLHHDPAIARLQIIGWLAYPRADRAEEAAQRLAWWPRAERGETVGEKPSRLKRQLASIDNLLRERLVAGFLYAAKVDRFLRSQPPWRDLELHPDLARLGAVINAAKDAANPPGTLEMMRRVDDAKTAGEGTWLRRLTAKSRPVLHLAAAWVEHSSVRAGATLRQMAFQPVTDGEIAEIIRNAELMRSHIADDPSNMTRAADMLRFVQCPTPQSAGCVLQG
jgi:hypothetical protein